MMQDTQEIVTGNWNPFDFLILGTSPIIIVIIVIFFIFLILSLFTNKRGISRAKRGRIFVFIFLFGFGFLFVSQSNLVLAQDVIHEPVIEVLDLFIDGTGGVFVNISKDYDWVARIIWHLEFIDNSLDFGVFAGEASTLTNGVDFFYNDISLIDGGAMIIKSNDDFGHPAFDIIILSDEKNPKARFITARYSFWKFTMSDGLLIDEDRSMGFLVQDNISALTSVLEFFVTIEGYSRTVNTFFSTGELYHPNAYNSLNLRFLKTNTDYNLKINSSSHEVLEWVNTTAKSETIKITFFVQAQDDNVISLWLYEGDTFLEQHDLVIIPIQTGIIEVFLSFLPYLLVSFLAIALFLGLAIPEKVGRRV